MSSHKVAHNRKLARLLQKWRWNFAHGTIRRRIYDLVSCHYPWWDWGHRMMIVTGSDWGGGNWSEPEPPVWYYRMVPGKRQWRTGYPTRRPQIVKTYDEFMSITEGINKDSYEHYEWRAICTSQDNELHIGRMYWGGNFYGLTYGEMRVLVRWLMRWEAINWFGLRTWLHKQGLHAAVETRKPFACNQSPPKGAGGYSHWLCHKKRGHEDPHSTGNYEWEDLGKVNYTGASQ